MSGLAVPSKRNQVPLAIPCVAELHTSRCDLQGLVLVVIPDRSRFAVVAPCAQTALRGYAQRDAFCFHDPSERIEGKRDLFPALVTLMRRAC